MVSFHCKLFVTYLIIWNLIYTIYLTHLHYLCGQHVRQLTHSHTFTGFIYVKETPFSYDFEVRQLTSQLICVVYKFNLTGGLTLHLGLSCLLLLFHCLRADLSVCVL